MANLFHTIFQTLQKRKLAFYIGLLILFAALIWKASSIAFNEDISKLIPTNTENKNLQKVLKTAQFSDKIIVNIQRDQSGSLDDLTMYASQFLDSLNKNSSAYIKKIQGKVEDEAIFETLDFVYSHLPLFLTNSDYAKIASQLSSDSIAKITEANYKTLISPSGIVAKKTIIKDPLGLSLMGLKHLKQLGISDDFVLKDGFLVTTDEQNLVLFITPTYPSSNTSENKLFSEELYTLQSNLNSEFLNKVKSSYFGGTLIAVANAQQIKNDIQFTVTVAMILLMGIFILFYRKLTIPIILFIPTVFGGLLSVTILSIIRSEISAISLGIGAVLLGVTLDYSLHILTHIRNKESIKDMFQNISKPILMSSLTTALAFLCLLFVDSQALQDLGIFAAVSVMGASVFALIFIPQVYKVTAQNNTKATFLDKIASYDFHKNKFLIGALALLLITSAFTYQRVSFNQDISKLNYQPKHIRDAESKLDKLINVSSKSLYVIAFGTDEQQVLETNDSIYFTLQLLKKNDRLINFNSAGALVSSKINQQQHIQKWKTFWSPEVVAQTTSNLEKSGNQYGFKSNTFQEFYTLIDRDFKALEIEDFKNAHLIPLDDFIATDNGFMTMSTLIKVNNGQVQDIKNQFKNSENTIVIDRQAINETMLSHLKEDFNNLILYCFIAVAVLLLLFYRNLKLTLVTLIPIVITWCVTVGIMGIFKLEFNIFNIIISTFIFGLGVDYSIFMTNGMRNAKETGILTVATHKTSIILSVLTTILGVGVLIFAKHPALFSISIISIIGILSAMLISFTIQPLLFRFLISKK